VYLVLSLTEDPTDWPRVDARLPTLPEPPPGTVRDLYLIASARQLRHHGEPEAAFDLLGPLVGKMVDPVARGMLEEEVAHDALEAHHDYEAIAYMDAWLRGSGEEQRDTVEGKVAALLAQLPDAVLENALRSMRAQSAGGYGVEIQRLVSQRLAAVAIAKNDPVLARWLLDPAASAAKIGVAAAAELGELATSKRGLGEVAGRTIGLLLPTGSTDLRDEAADVERGVAWALGLPRDHPERAEDTHLVTRDDGGDPERMIAGLEELAGEGASIILTALDGSAADRAIDWGEKNRIAVVAVAAPLVKQPGPFSFVVGEPEIEVVDLLASTIAARRGAGTMIAPVVEGDAVTLFGRGFAGADRSWTFFGAVGCDVEAPRAGEPRFPVAAWEHAGVKAWLVAGSADCARDVMREESGRSKGGIFGLSLIASTTAQRPPDAVVLAASAGVIPGDLKLSSKTPPGTRDADVRAMTARLGGRPNWWAALGHDAATLARDALADAPTDVVTTQAQIAQRRQAARDALAAARDRLWTTDEAGFGRDHKLARQVRVVDLSSRTAR
jgi:hypothetical protein